MTKNHFVAGLSLLTLAIAPPAFAQTKTVEAAPASAQPVLLRSPREGVSVSAITLEGLQNVQEQVVRRELETLPGSAYSSTRIAADLDRLVKLGLFSKITVQAQPAADGASQRLILDLEEAQPGRLALSVGFSSADGAIFDAALGQSNLGSVGLSGSLSTYLSVGRYSLLAAVSQPWLDDRKTSLDGLAYFGNPWTAPTVVGSPGQLPADSYSLRQQSKGGTILLDWSLGPVPATPAQAGFHVRAEHSDWLFSSSSGARFLPSNQSRDVLSLGGQFRFDTLDNPTLAHRGDAVLLYADQEIPPGSSTLSQVQAFGTHVMPLWYGHALALQLAGGARLALWGSAAAMADRFFPAQHFGVAEWSMSPLQLGQADYQIRGWSEDRDLAYSGDSFAVGRLEYRFPIWGIVSGHLFADTGAFWDTAQQDFGWDRLRSGFGPGLLLNTPLGMMRLDLGFASLTPLVMRPSLSIGYQMF